MSQKNNKPESITETIYFHRSKEDNWGIKEKLDVAGIDSSTALCIGYEVGMKIQIYTNEEYELMTKVLEINNIDVSDKDIFI